MKPNLNPDSAAHPRHLPACARVVSMLVLAAIVPGLTLFALRPAPIPQALAQGAIPAFTGNEFTRHQPTILHPAQDHFVMMADPSIDPQMVVPAPEGIDEAMVHHHLRPVW